MRKIAIAVLTMFVAAAAFAHKGHIHNYLGTVKAIDAWHLLITTPEKHDVDIVLTKATKFTRNGATARKADLKRGMRVSVYVADDGKTATNILLPPRV